MHRYIEKILRAKVYDVAVETPLDHTPGLSRRLENSVYLKREDLQPVFSFKLRGAYNKIALLDEATRAKGVALSVRLTGAQVSRSERKAFQEFLDASGFACREETHNSAYRLFAGGSETSG